MTVRLYAWTFVIAASIAPLALPLHWLRHDPEHPALNWALILPAMVGIQVLFLYVQRRCSSASLSFWQGLYYAAWSMSTGWSYMSMFIIFPALSLLSVAALFIGLYADILRKPELAQIWFRKLLAFFYRNRMRQ